jgi:hypothetical protein
LTPFSWFKSAKNSLKIRSLTLFSNSNIFQNLIENSNFKISTVDFDGEAALYYDKTNGKWIENWPKPPGCFKDYAGDRGGALLKYLKEERVINIPTKHVPVPEHTGYRSSGIQMFVRYQTIPRYDSPVPDTGGLLREISHTGIPRYRRFGLFFIFLGKVYMKYEAMKI